MRNLFLIIALMLCGCDEERKEEYGLQFEVFCPNSTSYASYTTDRNGRIKSMQPGFWSTWFIRYGGGLFQDGKFKPMEWPNCKVTAKAATLINGFPPKPLF